MRRKRLSAARSPTSRSTAISQAENALPAADIDLAVRAGFAKHQLVGLNVFFIEMARQFYETLGIRTADPMLVSKGVLRWI